MFILGIDKDIKPLTGITYNEPINFNIEVKIPEFDPSKYICNDTVISKDESEDK